MESLKGWHQIAFERDLAKDIFPAALRGTPLMIIKGPDGIKVFYSTCPHRGANLAVGGALSWPFLKCPFHGLNICLESKREGNYFATELPSVNLGGLIFVCFDEKFDFGFRNFFSEFEKSHIIVPGFTLGVNAPHFMVIENAFDNLHFKSVHGVFNEPDFELLDSKHGEYSVSGEFLIPPSIWQSSPDSKNIKVPFVATAFSPGLIISHMRGDNPYSVLTSSCPIDDHHSIVRLSVAIPFVSEPRTVEDRLRYLLAQMEKGLMADQVIWNNINYDAIPTYHARDEAVLGFRKFMSYFK